MKTVCFTGHRPNKLGGFDERNPVADYVKQELKTAVLWAIKDGYRRFICGGALGVDTWAAEIVLSMKEDHPDVTLTIARPFKSQASRWKFADVERFNFICSLADEVVDVCEDGYAAWKMQKRNEWMCDHSELIVAVWDGGDGGTKNCFDYAKQKDLEFVKIDPRRYSKDTSQIPTGIYCYEALSIVKGEQGEPIMKTRVCPYFSYDLSKGSQNCGKCNYLEVSDWEGTSNGLLWDQVKCCGINEDWDEIEKAMS